MFLLKLKCGTHQLSPFISIYIHKLLLYILEYVSRKGVLSPKFCILENENE